MFVVSVSVRAKVICPFAWYCEMVPSTTLLQSRVADVSSFICELVVYSHNLLCTHARCGSITTWATCVQQPIVLVLFPWSQTLFKVRHQSSQLIATGQDSSLCCPGRSSKIPVFLPLPSCLSFSFWKGGNRNRGKSRRHSSFCRGKGSNQRKKEQVQEKKDQNQDTIETHSHRHTQ